MAISNRPISLLSCRVPYLSFDAGAGGGVEDYFGGEFDADGGLGGEGEGGDVARGVGELFGVGGGVVA